MGHDDGTPTKHEHINFEMQQGQPSARPFSAALRFTNPPPPNDVVFTGTFDGLQTVLLTITADGKPLPGRNLSSDVATQKVAALLVSHYAVEIDVQIRALKAQIAELQRSHAEALDKMSHALSGEPT